MNKAVLDLWADYIQFVKDNHPVQYAEMIAKAEARRTGMTAESDSVEVHAEVMS